MKIAIIGNFRRGWDTSVTDETHIADALNSNHFVYKIQRDEIQWEELPQLDIAIIAQWDLYPDDFVERLKKTCGKPIVIYWAFDYQSLPRQPWHEHLAIDADIFLSKEMDNREEYLAMGANFHWLPQDFAPATLKPAEEVEKDIDILFMGTYLPHAVERNRLLKAIDDKYNLTICSITPVDWKHAGFKNVQDVMIDEESAKMVARAKINISIDHTNKEGYWSDRNAQIMVCGGFVLFRYVPMSEIVFGSTVEYFHNEEQMFKSIDKYLKADSLRDMWAKFGQEYADNHLRVGNRVHQMMQIVESYRDENSSI